MTAEATKRWRDNPSVQEKEKEYRSSPEVKAKRNEAVKRYRQTEQYKEAELRRRNDPVSRPKRLARLAVSNALQDGKITKQPCHCGSTDVEAHHEDYSNPLDIQWLCKDHHREIGRKHG